MTSTVSHGKSHPLRGGWDCEASTGMSRQDASSRGSLLPAREIGLVGAPGTGRSPGQLRADGKTDGGQDRTVTRLHVNL
jgi:hypothetical protein